MGIYMRTGFVAAILAALSFTPAYAGTEDAGVSFVFAPASQGRELLTARDEFVTRLTRFDRSARMKTAREVPEDVYLRFVADNVLEWSDEEARLLRHALSAVKLRIDALGLPWPDAVFLVKTSGSEEGNAAYTRGNAIVLPAAMLAPENASLHEKILAHELFHILSRGNPDLREQLYAVIGFIACGEKGYPPGIEPLKLTNPDAPRNDSCIRLRVDGAPTWAIPVLYSRVPQYDETRGGSFFDYIQLKFLLLESGSLSEASSATFDNGRARLVDVDRVSGFYEQVGRNTDYIVHPEEILADNFALMVLGVENVPSPVIVRDIRERLDLWRSTRVHNGGMMN